MSKIVCLPGRYLIHNQITRSSGDGEETYLE